VSCPRCGRPSQAGRTTCLYCGAALGGAAIAKAAEAAAAPALPAVPRTLLVLDLRQAEPARLARALGLSAFEARQWVRRGGYRLHRIADKRLAEAEAERLAAHDVAVVRLGEAEVRRAAQPLHALEGRMGADGLELRTPESRLRLGASELLIVVKGPIARERQAGGKLRLRSAVPEPGIRVHLHRRAELAPVELDPELLALGAGAQGSALLQITGWLGELARGIPLDDDFRHLPPALAPALPAPGGAAGALQAAGRAEPDALLLDNLAQFRFYSAWRAALERLR
jgi:hypothetical protein